MKRGGPLARKTPLRRGVPLNRGAAPRKVAPRRAGLWASEREQLKDLHRRVVMTRWGKVEVAKAKGGYSWWGACEHCGRETWLQCSHIEPVGRAPAMAFDSDNAVPLCGGCHIYWWHKYPRQAEAWIIEKLGKPLRDALARRADTIGRRRDFGAYRVALVEELRRLTNGREPAEA